MQPILSPEAVGPVVKEALIIGGKKHNKTYKKKRRGNKSLTAWVKFVKKVAREEKLPYRDAMMRAKVRKDKGEKWMSGGIGTPIDGDRSVSNDEPAFDGPVDGAVDGAVDGPVDGANPGAELGGRRRRSRRNKSKKRRGSKRRGSKRRR
jgi:hypothetical protein